MQAFLKIPSAILGGFVGGVIVGLVEAALIAYGGGGQEYGAFRFAAISYGILGAALGGGIGVASAVLAFLARDARAAGALSAGAVAALLGFAVSRFRIVRDLFAESLPIASSQGLMVHAGLLVGALLVLLLVRRLVLSISREGGAGIVSSAVLAALLVAGGAATSAGLDRMTTGGPAPTVPATAKGPSVILIIADTLRADRVGAYGSTTTRTPGMDRLAKDGVLFEKAWSNSTWTRPSVATILTSLYPSSHKAIRKADLLPDGVTTVAEVMKGAGYRTVGYVTSANVAPPFNFEQGFDEYHYLTPEFFFGATDSGSRLALYGVLGFLRGRFVAEDKWVQNYYQDARAVNGEALPWLDRNAAGPFFALIHYMDPHDPYFEIPYNGVAIARADTSNPDSSQRDRLADLYSSNVEYLDRFINNVIEALKAAGRYDDTTIALVADHGEEFYEHKGWWHGTTLYDEESHVPLIVKLPKNAKAGTRVKGPVQLLDVAPTLIGTAGVAAPEAWQGRNLFSDAPVPTAFLQEENHEGNVLFSIRTDRWKLILANEGNPRGLAPVELYDMSVDPKETRNVAADNAEVVTRLSADLETMKRQASSRAESGLRSEKIDSPPPGS